MIEELRLEALGTTCHLLAAGVGRGRLAWAAGWIRERDDRFSRFQPDSEVSQLNRAAGQRWVPVSAELEELLGAALWAHGRSGGLVHAGVLGPMLAAGYTRPLREGPEPARALPVAPLPPLPELLAVAPGRARLRRGFGVDLGGIAKGWMADRLALELGPCCVVNLGGDLFARGDGPDGGGWPVGFAGRTLLLRGRGVATSGVTGRRWLDEGRVHHHLVDPRTSHPAATGVAVVSVVASTALEAEVLAKTALLLGPERGRAHLAAASPAWDLREAA